MDMHLFYLRCLGCYLFFAKFVWVVTYFLLNLFGLLLVSVYVVFCIQLYWSTLCACYLHSGSEVCVSRFMGPIILVVEVVELCIKPTFGFQNNYLISQKNICSL
jgi:hypothetical protein